MNKLLATLSLAVALIAPQIAPKSASAQSSPSDYTSATRYDDLGREVGTIAPDPDGIGGLKYLATRTTYDNRGNVTKVETGELQSWKSEMVLPANWGSDFDNHIHTTVDTTYDAANRKLTEMMSDSGGNAIGLTQYSYDNVGRLECTAVRMNPAAYGSLPASACTLGTQGGDGPDRITKTIYDDAGQVLQIRQAVGTSIEIADVTYSYTDNGQIEQVVDANGNRAEQRYDAYDRQVRWVFPSTAGATSFNNATPATAMSTAGSINNGDYEEYTYDANGNRLTLRKRDGSVISYTYDDLNRVTKKDLPNTRPELPSTHRRDVYYGYDLRGLQTYARFSSHSGIGVTYTYDGFGRLTAEAQSSDGNLRTVSSQYDDNGNRTRVTHPDSQYFEWEHDKLNRVTALKQAATQLGTGSYNNRGQFTQKAWLLGAGQVSASNYGYDNAGRLDSLGFDLSATSADVTWSYTRNPASQILSEAQTNDAYSWDGHAAFSRAYTTNGLNQYTGVGSDAYCYDANGNLTADGASVYLYDYENRLVQKRAQVNSVCSALAYTGTLEANLHYDPTGRLYQLGGGTHRFLYDGNALVAEYNTVGTILRRYVHGSNLDADDPLIWYEGSTVSNASRRYLHADPRGSIVAVANYLGISTATNTYDEFGIPDSAAGNDIATKGRFRYTGQLWIPELGMYYYKARIYSPTLGRFLQTDPIGYEDQFNLYAYVGNDPINGTDPTGMCTGSKMKNADGTCRGTGRWTTGFSGLQYGKVSDDQKWGRSGTSKRRSPTAPNVAEGTTGSTQTPRPPPVVNPVTANPATVVAAGIAGVARIWYAIVTDEGIDEWKVGYHYTDAEGLTGIVDGGVIRSDGNNRVYYTNRRLSPAEARNAVFAGGTRPGDENKGDFVIAFRYKKGTLNDIPDQNGFGNFFHFGSIRTRGRQVFVTYSGPNDF